MAMYIASRRFSGGSAVGALRYAACTLWRPYSTSFREEKDTFGPILVPSDKSVSLFLLLLKATREVLRFVLTKLFPCAFKVVGGTDAEIFAEL
jgi:hypothetical protein